MTISKRLFYQWLLGLVFFMNWEVVGGAMVWHILAGKIIGHASTPEFQYLILGCSVFVIYGLDRLLDVWHLHDVPLTERQLFYKTFRGFVVFMLLLAFGWGVYLFIHHFSVALITKGGLILGISIAYLILRHLNLLTGVARESFVAAVFTLAIWGYQIIPGQGMSIYVALLCAAFAVTCLANMLLISWREVLTDNAQHNQSAALVMGIPRVRFHALIAILLAMILSLVTFWLSPIAMVDVTAALLILHNLANYFMRQRYIKNVVVFRFVIDSLFLLPVITLL
jgi:hypothetical protein